jgi:hypothetical protein
MVAPSPMAIKEHNLKLDSKVQSYMDWRIGGGRGKSWGDMHTWIVNRKVHLVGQEVEEETVAT